VSGQWTARFSRERLVRDAAVVAARRQRADLGDFADAIAGTTSTRWLSRIRSGGTVRTSVGKTCMQRSRKIDHLWSILEVRGSGRECKNGRVDAAFTRSGPLLVLPDMGGGRRRPAPGRDRPKSDLENENKIA
jgi:hypothetical protein